MTHTASTDPPLAAPVARSRSARYALIAALWLIAIAAALAADNRVAIWLMDRTKQDVREVAEEQGLSIAQLDVLRRLAKGPSPMRRLAEQMNCEASNLTGLVASGD